MHLEKESFFWETLLLNLVAKVFQTSLPCLLNACGNRVVTLLGQPVTRITTLSHPPPLAPNAAMVLSIHRSLTSHGPAKLTNQ